MSYRIRRVDDNQKEIVAQFRKLGASVWITSEIGRGAPDLVIAYRKVTVLVELKDGNKSLSQRKLTPLEAKFHLEWQGLICVIENTQAVIDLMISLGWTG